jgi:hypothetical protein
MTAGQQGGMVEGRKAPARSLASARDDIAPPLSQPAASPTCLRCNFPVPARAMSCRNPCPNCGTLYPLGDCSD